MKRRVSEHLVPILIAAVLAAFQGCGKRDIPDAVEDANPGGVSVVVYYPFTRGPEEAFLSLVDGFNGSNAWGIEVVPEYAGTWEDLYTMLSDGTRSGSLPDAAILYPSDAVRFGEAGSALELTKYTGSKRWGFNETTDPLFEKILKCDRSLSGEGDLYALPFSRRTHVLYCNRGMMSSLGLTDPPATWQDLEEAVSALPGRSGSPVALALRPCASDVSAILASRWGGYAREEYPYTGKAAKELLSDLQGLYDRGRLFISEDPWGPQMMFCESRVLFAIDTSDALIWYDETIGSMDEPIEWTVVPLPGTKEGSVLLEGFSWTIFPSDSARETAAWLFARWLTEAEQQVLWSSATGMLPVSAQARDLLLEREALPAGFAGTVTELENKSLSSGRFSLAEQDTLESLSRCFAGILTGGDIDAALETIGDITGAK